jgi:hypothetical protein
LAAAALVVVALCAYVQRSDVNYQGIPPSVAEAAQIGADPSDSERKMGPATSALQGEIAEALKATEWPELDPSIESVISQPLVLPEIAACSGQVAQDSGSCTWGADSATTRIVVVGDSIAMTYLGPFKEIALNSAGRVQVHAEAMFGCEFIDDLLYINDENAMAACPGRKQEVIDVINASKPDVVVISNVYVDKKIAGSNRVMTPKEWSESIRRIVDKIGGSTKKIVFLAAPPASVNIEECYGKPSSTPASCIGSITRTWRSRALVEQDLAKSIGGTWADSRLWFCYGGRCPSFVGLTPTKWDIAHMSQEYGLKIAPVIGEALQEAGVF